MTSKILSIILTFAIALSLCTFGVLAAGAGLTFDSSSVESRLPVGTTFELPVILSPYAGLYSFNLQISFDKELISAQSITPGVTGGIEGVKTLDNTKGTIEYWYSYNGKTPTSTLAKITFKVLKEGDAKITVNKNTSEFLRLLTEESALEAFEVDFSDAEKTISVGSDELAPPEFTTTERTFYNYMTVRFKPRTDGAQIYFSVTNNTVLDKPYYSDEGIYITRTTTIVAVARLGDKESNKVTGQFTLRSNTGGTTTGGGSYGGSGGITVGNVNNNTANNNTDGENANQPKYFDMQEHWGKPFFETLIDKGIISGYEDGSVRPDNEITRNEAVKIIVSALGLSPADNFVLDFADNDDIDDWARGYVQTAVNRGVLSGYEDNTFRPRQSISRQELVVLVARAFNMPPQGAEITFSDGGTIADWALDSIASAVKLGIISGYDDGEFKPTRPVTRAEASKIISLCMETIL